MVEAVKEYGDLSEEELYAFLEEIQSDDEALQEEQELFDDTIITETEQDFIIEEPENAAIEAKYGDAAWSSFVTEKTKSIKLLDKEHWAQVRRKAQVGNRIRLNKLKLDRIEIQRLAFSQELIDLMAPFNKEDTKRLISVLTEKHTKIITRHAYFINKRLATLLNPLIPRRLRLCKKHFPQSVRKCPGFLYRASIEYGGGYSFWATPDIPYFFEQNTEQSQISKAKAQFLFTVDRSVQAYHKHLSIRAEKEIRYASVLLQKGVNTYLDLLKVNPFWFNQLYDNLISINE